MTGAWGEPSRRDADLHTGLPNGTIRRTEAGGFHALKVRPEGVAAILKSKAVTDAVEAKTVAMTNFAQSIALTENAYYEAKVLYKDHPTWPARGFVVAENYKAVIDDRYHSTLLKVAAHFPSDTPYEHVAPPVMEAVKQAEVTHQKPVPTAKSSTRHDGLWVDRNGRWRNQAGRYSKAPEAG